MSRQCVHEAGELMCVLQEERDSLIQEVIEKNGGFKVLYYIHVHTFTHTMYPLQQPLLHDCVCVCVCVCAGFLW